MAFRHLAAKILTSGWGLANRIVQARPSFRVLMYHAIGTPIPEDKLNLYSIAPQRFKEQMQVLSQEHAIYSLSNENICNPGMAITFDDGYRDVLTEAAPILASLGLPFTVFVTSGYVASGDKMYLSPRELQELAEIPGATIGSHGTTHSKLADCSSGDLMRELTDSRQYLEDLLQKPVLTLSYPHGSANKEVVDAAKITGYTLAACSRFGTNHAGHDPFMLNRTDIWSTDNLGDFRGKVSGSWDWMKFRT